MCITPMRSASAKASSWSCVTRMVVVPRRRCTSRTVSRSSTRILASSAPKGSSSTSTAGSCASARATATRCCWPPESCAGLALAEALERHELQQLRAALAALGRAHAAHLQRELDVLGHRHVAEQRVVLEHEADAALARRHVGDVAAAEQDAAVLDVGQAGEGAQQRALAAAAGAEQHEELARGDVERDVVDDGPALVALRDLFELDRHAARPRAARGIPRASASSDRLSFGMRALRALSVMYGP
jgi:hypothetical protein